MVRAFRFARWCGCRPTTCWWLTAGCGARDGGGGAVSGAGLEWSAIADPYTLRVPGYEYFSFNDFDYAKPYVARDALRAKGTTKTDGSGVASFGVPAALATSESAQQFTLGAAVQDQNGQVVAGSTTVTVHPAALYAGIHPAQYVANEGANARIDLVTVEARVVVASIATYLGYAGTLAELRQGPAPPRHFGDGTAAPD